jgi:hypothetical protein
LAVRFNVCPLHNGVLLPAVGVAGGFGSESTIDVITLEVHPFNVTLILE